MINFAGTYDDLLSIELIRTHTKTDDAPGVTDEQLRLYCNAGFEAAEEYTGINLTPMRTVTETVALRGRTGRIHLTYAIGEPPVTFYGSSLMQPVIVIANVGSKTVDFPNGHPDRFHTVGDCRKCGVDDPLMVTYKSGRACNGKPVPNAILMGVLKYIAWNVRNPGDVIMTTRNAQSVGNNGLSGSNNSALISGAIDEWKRVRKVVY